MPDLSGYQDIRDFIACVAHGMLIGAIDAIEGPKLLYAAQVASGVLRHEPKEQKQPVAYPLPPYLLVTRCRRNGNDRLHWQPQPISHEDLTV